VIEDRHGERSLVICGQLPGKAWHKYIGDPAVADAALDRIVHNAHQITLKGESMRKTRSNLTEAAVGELNPTSVAPLRPGRCSPSLAPGDRLARNE
jgi:hypothetical protein